MKTTKAMGHLPLWLSALLMAGGLAAWGAYNIIGSEVDAQGVLREPFGLIPIGWLLVAAGLAIGGFYLIARLVMALATTISHYIN